jgi:NAD(P)H dehydrogenase (quinone)
MGQSPDMTQATKILIIMGNPDLDSLAARAADAYADRASKLGADVTRIDLAQLRFDLVLRHGYREEQPLEPDLVQARDALLAADHVVFAFPLWWSSMPAVVKGFIDRVFTPGFAFAYPPGGGLPKRLLGGRSARFITTMDAPNLWYRLRMRSVLHASFVTGTLQFVGFAPVRSTTFYSMREKSARARETALARVRDCAEQDMRALVRVRRSSGKALLPPSIAAG